VTVFYRILVEAINKWHVPKSVAAQGLVLSSANAGLKAEGGMRFAFPPYGYSFYAPDL
jgi:hypothetical protein